MGLNQPQHEKNIWKRLNDITARQFIETLPEKYLSIAGTVVLGLMAAVPVLVSALFREPAEFLPESISDVSRRLFYTTQFGNTWFQVLLGLGFFTALISACALAKLHYREGLASRFRPSRIRESLLPFCLLLVLLWSILSASFSNDPKTCFVGDPYRQDGVLTYGLYALVFITAMQLSDRHMRCVAETLCAVCAVTGIIVITGGKLIPGLFYLENDLRALMFHQYNHYGYFLAVCFPVCFGLILSDEKPGWLLTPVRLAEFWLICNAIAFNSVRGSFLAIVAALVGWNLAVLCGHREKWKKMLLLDILFIATILGLNTGSTLLDRMDVLVDQLESLFGTAPDIPQATAAPQPQVTAPQSAAPAGNTAVSSAVDHLGSERGLLWRLGIQFALDRPIFGHGPDNLGPLYMAYRADIPDRPHNELIQIAASLGFPALAFYVTAIAAHVADFFRFFKKLSVFHLAVFASTGCYLVSSLFGNTMYYTTPYYFMMLGFGYRIFKEFKNQQA